MGADKLDVMAEILRSFYANHKGDSAWLAREYERAGITEDDRNDYERRYEFECERREGDRR